MQVSILCRFPREILERIALEVVLIDPIGLPLGLTPLLCSCKWINRLLSIENAPDLHARIFRGMFDFGAPFRRFGPKATYTQNLAAQLRTYCAVLKALRRGDIYAPHILGVFWGAFFMLTENDGRNRAQLEWAGLEDFVDRFVRTRLHEGRSQNGGWPVESPINALALWLMWTMSTQERLASETEQQRQQIIDLVLPFVIVACRYPSAHIPQNHFEVPLPVELDEVFPHSVETAHGAYPLYREPDDILDVFPHYGSDLKISPPLITTYAKLIYFSRRETVPVGVPPHLPLDRAHAIQLGQTQIAPTQADVREFNAHKGAKLVPRTQWDWWKTLTNEQLQLEDEGIWHRDLKAASAHWDHDFMRWMYCWNPWVDQPLKGVVYTYGMLDGLWQGRMLVPNEAAYMQLITTHDLPPGFGERQPFVTAVPLYMRLREHHCINPELPVLVGGKDDGFDDGLVNAWLPHVRMMENGGILRVEDPQGNVSRYETYYPGRENSHHEDTCTRCLRLREEGTRSHSPHSEFEDMFSEAGLGRDPSDDDEDEDFMENSCQGIEDIILTGETDLQHGQAWNHYKFYGRVRAWDGLICLIRVPVRDDSYFLGANYIDTGLFQLGNPTTNWLGRWVFTGYITGGQNFVGNWRAMRGDVEMPAWEAAFAVSKRA